MTYAATTRSWSASRGRLRFSIADGHFLTKRGEERPANKDATRPSTPPSSPRCSWPGIANVPNISYNEKRLFDGTTRPCSAPATTRCRCSPFRPGHRDQGIVAEPHVRRRAQGGKSYVKFHVLFVVSTIIARANKQQLVVDPRRRSRPPNNRTTILTLAASCLDNAFQNAVNMQVPGKVFNAQNWLKAVASVQAEASRPVPWRRLPGFPNGKALSKPMTAPATAFASRWSADQEQVDLRNRAHAPDGNHAHRQVPVLIPQGHRSGRSRPSQERITEMTPTQSLGAAGRCADRLGDEGHSFDRPQGDYGCRVQVGSIPGHTPRGLHRTRTMRAFWNTTFRVMK